MGDQRSHHESEINPHRLSYLLPMMWEFEDDHRTVEPRRLGRRLWPSGRWEFGVPLGNLYRRWRNRCSATVKPGYAPASAYFDTAPFYGMGSASGGSAFIFGSASWNKYVLST